VAAVHRGVYQATGGRLGGRLGKVPVLLLTTRGRRTGRPRTTPLAYFQDGDSIVLVASNGGAPRHPNWYENLTVHPEVRVTRGRSTQAMTARTATAEEKRRLWPVVVSAYRGYERYQQRTSREIPLVILTPY
jgi:deazaflavin-dependent oxidoreductase (nitroreductase family)